MSGGRVRRCGPVAAVAVALVAAGCGGSGDDPAAQDAPVPDATYGGLMPAAQAPPPEGFAVAGVEGIRVDVPDDWSTSDTDEGLCVLPPEAEECGYGAFLVFPNVTERQPDEWPDDEFDEDDGWAADPEYCRSRATADSEDVEVDDEELSVDNAFGEHPDPDADDGLRRSHHRVWSVSCENDDSFQVWLWFLPESDVAAYVWSVDSRYEDVYRHMAESMDVTDYL